MLTEVYNDVKNVEKSCSDVVPLNFGLVQVVYEWAHGKVSFKRLLFVFYCRLVHRKHRGSFNDHFFVAIRGNNGIGRR